jgi:tetratricopeptide (TPR) repeat protein
MDDEHLRNLENLLQTHRRRLAHAMQQAATFGVHVPTHIKMDIEDAQQQIARIEAELHVHMPPDNRVALRETWQQALKAFYRADWERAVELLAQIVAVAPDYEHVQEKLAEAQRQISLQTFYQAIGSLRAEGQWRAVLTALSDLERRAPGYSDTDGLRSWAEQQQAHEQYYPPARAAADRGDWVAAVAALEALLALAPGDDEARALLEQARDEQEAIADKIETLYVKLLKAESSRNYPVAIDLGERILALDPTHQPARIKTAAAYVKRRPVETSWSGELSIKMKRTESDSDVRAELRAAFNRAIELDPETAEHYFLRGALIRDIADLNRAIEIDAGKAEYYYYRAWRYYYIYKYEAETPRAQAQSKAAALRDLDHAADLGYADRHEMLRQLLSDD